MNIRQLNKRIAPAVAKDDKHSAQIEVDAPAGMVSVAWKLHWQQEDYDSSGDGWYPTRQEVYEKLIEDWADGVEPCEIEDCDICEGAS